MEEMNINLKREAVRTLTEGILFWYCWIFLSSPFHIIYIICLFPLSLSFYGTRSRCVDKEVCFQTQTSRPSRSPSPTVCGCSMIWYRSRSVRSVLVSVMFVVTELWPLKTNRKVLLHLFVLMVDVCVLQRSGPSRLMDAASANQTEQNIRAYHTMNHFLGSIIDHVSTKALT